MSFVASAGATEVAPKSNNSVVEAAHVKQTPRLRTVANGAMDLLVFREYIGVMRGVGFFSFSNVFNTVVLGFARL
jgi:hypothetical protein